MLAAALLAFKSFGIWVKVGIVVAILAIIALAVWSVYHSIYKTGYTAAKEELRPQIEKLQQDLKNANADLTQARQINDTFRGELARLSQLVRDQNLATDKLQADAIEAQNRARDALTRLAANQKRYTAEIARLQSIVNGPPMTERDCEEADSIMRSILRDRLSDNPRAAAPGGDGRAEGGDGKGDRAAAVHRQGGDAGEAAANQDRFEEGQHGADRGGGGARLAGAG